MMTNGTIGKIGVNIDQVTNGAWVASADVITFNSNIRIYLTNIMQWQSDGGNIQAQLQPYGGSNSITYTGSDNMRIQVVVSNISVASTLRWTYTVYHTHY